MALIMKRKAAARILKLGIVFVAGLLMLSLKEAAVNRYDMTGNADQMESHAGKLHQEPRLKHNPVTRQTCYIIHF